MKNIKITLAILVILLFAACIPAIASPSENKNEPINSINSGPRLSETPNINVADQFGNPVANVTINVVHEQNGDITNLEVITPSNGMVPLEGLEGTYTYTVKTVPTGYTTTDQKIIQAYKPGASFNGKTITISKNDNYNPRQFSTSLNNYFGGINISSDYNFTANFVFEFKTFLEGMIREQIKIVNEEEKKAAEQNKPTPTPMPTPEPSPMPIPTPTPTPAPTTLP